jgi:hypothetical protein
MAEVKISALASATSLVGTEAVPVVQGGVTRRVRTSEIAGLLQPAIDVVSTTLAAEVSARGADVKRLSDQISDIISAGGGAISVNSAEMNAVSVAAKLHADIVSLNLENEISARAAASIAASAKNTAGTSVRGAQNIADALSSRISAIVAGANSVTSAEVSLLQNTSVKNSAGNSIKGRQSVFNALSARISDVEAHASAASDAATSANLHANAASAAATSIWNHISATSVKSVGGTTSVKGGLQSVLNALSNRISAASTANTASVTSVELLSAVNNASARNSAGTSVHGLQSIVDALSGRISGIVAGAVSVTSDDVSAVSALAKQSISVVSAALAVEIVDRVSADALLLHRISVVSAAIDAEHVRASIAEKAFSDLLSNAAINTASALSVLSANVLLAHGFISTLSDAHTSLVNRVQALSATGGAVSSNSNEISQRISLAVSALNKASVRNTANVSVQGHQSVLNAFSVRIAAGGGGGSGSVTSTELLCVKNSVLDQTSANLAALSVIVKNLSDTVSNRTLSIAALSLAVSAAETHASTASTAATAADTHANAASDAATSVNARATSLETRLSTLSALHQALSDVVSNALSAGDVLSNSISAISNKMSVISANIGTPQLRRLTTTATISASGLTKISGLSATMVSTGSYKVHAVLMHSHSLAATNGFGFGVSGPVVTMATGVWRGFTSVVQPASAIFGYFNQAGLGSITYSVAGTHASATNYRTELDMDLVNVTSGTLQLKARSSAATTGAIDVQAGSYIQAFRIN